MYIILPDSEAQPWLPVAGVTLVCLPWLFWSLTCLYRIISRICGIRVGGNYNGGGGGSNRGGSANANNNTTGDVVVETTAAADESDMGNPQYGSRQVQFGSVVVVGEQDDDHRGNGKHEKHSSSSSSSNDMSSIASHESEMPLSLSMAK
ncbi:putative Membrane lipoprotein [Quillaja saponaria]|uniref:Membrane lipoprotein n=1 Tax=Quillaja saponaria TaxID=32244 RepID=A0AAD7PAG7_QUISA|nr:putative Membrane lipoprotein [Quillaja saponaria]KAJ7948087.1 putative Membrane lipoprotein [Quillaja saponaria]